MVKLPFPKSLSMTLAAATMLAVSVQAQAQDKAAAAPQLKDPVAVVNGEKITKAQLEEALNEAVQASGMKAEDLTAEQKMEGYRQILDDLIMDKLLTKAAEDIKVDQAQVDAEIAKLKTRFPSEEEFQKQLKEVGQTEAKLNEAITKMMKQRQWVDSKVGAKTEVTEAEASDFYNSNKEEFEQPETVKASHVLFLVDKDAPEDVVKKQLEAAKAAAARAKKGEDFTALAKELSEEPGAKESGGDLGFFSKDRMVPEFADAAFAQTPGDISEPVRTQFGWHVIKVTEKKPAGLTPYDEVKEQLLAFLKADKQRKAVEGVLKELRDGSKVENTLPPAPPAAALPAMPTSH